MSESFMSEYTDTEVKPEAPEVKIPEATPEATQEVNPKEVQARSHGWAPKEEWKGDPKDWVDAEVFNIRGPLFDKIKSQKEELTELRKNQDSIIQQQKVMQSILKKTREDERKRVLTELEQRKIQHLEEGKYADVVKTDAEIAKLKDEKEEVPQEQPQSHAKALKDFTEKNKWYFKNQGMKEYADVMGKIYMDENPGSTPENILMYVEDSVRNEYPDYFNGAPTASPVGNQTSESFPSKTNKKLSKRDLDDTHREVLRNFVAHDTTGRSDADIEASIIAEWQSIGEI